MFENQNVDNIGQVAEGTVERAGLNILGLVTSLANQQLDTEIRSEVIAIMVLVMSRRKMLIVTMRIRIE